LEANGKLVRIGALRLQQVRRRKKIEAGGLVGLSRLTYTPCVEPEDFGSASTIALSLLKFDGSSVH